MSNVAEGRIWFLSCHLRKEQKANQDKTVYRHTTALQCFASLMGGFSIKSAGGRLT